MADLHLNRCLLARITTQIFMTFDTYLLKFFCDSFQKFIGCSLHFEESYTELLLA